MRRGVLWAPSPRLKKPRTCPALAVHDLKRSRCEAGTADYTVMSGRVLGMQSGASSTVASAAFTVALAAAAALVALT